MSRCVSIGHGRRWKRLGIIGQGDITGNAHNSYIHACIHYRLGQVRLGKVDWRSGQVWKGKAKFIKRQDKSSWKGAI